MPTFATRRGEIVFRDSDGETSQRYLIRLGFEREIARGNGLLVVPYIRAGSLRLPLQQPEPADMQFGAEFGLTRAWRIEPCFSRQNDSRSKSANVGQLGLILKYFHWR